MHGRNSLHTFLHTFQSCCWFHFTYFMLSPKPNEKGVEWERVSVRMLRMCGNAQVVDVVFVKLIFYSCGYLTVKPLLAGKCFSGHDTWHDVTVGAFSHSTAAGELRKDLPDVPIDARVMFPRWSLGEAAAVSHYRLRYAGLVYLINYVYPYEKKTVDSLRIVSLCCVISWAWSGCKLGFDRGSLEIYPHIYQQIYSTQMSCHRFKLVLDVEK